MGVRPLRPLGMAFGPTAFGAPLSHSTEATRPAAKRVRRPGTGGAQRLFDVPDEFVTNPMGYLLASLN